MLLSWRKAQAAFLQHVPLETLPQPLPLFRESTKNAVNEADFWTQVYQDGRDGWELGEATPVLTSEFPAVKAHLPPRSSVLVPGAGRGHDAIFLDQQGLCVTAVDFSTAALDEFKRLYPDSRVTVVEVDAFEFLKGHPAAFAPRARVVGGVRTAEFVKTRSRKIKGLKKPSRLE